MQSFQEVGKLWMGGSFYLLSRLHSFSSSLMKKDITHLVTIIECG